METIVRINNRSKAAKLLLEYVETLSFAKVENSKRRFNKETEKAIKEARASIGIIKTSNHEDLMKKLRN
jgi:antitoxin component of RelBE/YafQ-DinJ toxin-antitoxin module